MYVWWNKRKLRHIWNLKLIYLITSFHLQTNPSVGVCSSKCEWENLYGRSLGSPIKPHKSVNIAYVHLLHLCRPHNDDAYSWWVWQSVAGVSSSTPSARLRPKLGAFLVVELSVVHTGRECPKHARMATSQGMEQANRDDPHCSAAGTAILSSPNEVLRCHPAALRGVVEQKAEQPAVALHWCSVGLSEFR